MQTPCTRRAAAASLALAALAACSPARQTEVQSSTPANTTVIPVDASTLPAGVTVEARLDQTLGTGNSKVGDTFTATVQNAVTSQGGTTVVPAGAKIEGRITALEKSGNATEPSVIRLDFGRLTIDGRTYPFEAAVEKAAPQTSGGDTRNETLKKAGVGAAAGAVLGAIIGDADLKSMAIGAVLGAAAGTAISLGTGEVESSLPAGTTLTLRTTQQVALR
jgi:hypothetical protein